MKIRPDNFGDLIAFQVVAAERSFTRAATRLGVTQSALSQTVKRLEERLGLSLLARTTRSVTPTEAGERLLATLAPALVDIAAELEAIAELRDRPSGVVRVTAGKHAVDTVLWPALKTLLSTYPEIQIEISVSSALQDIVAQQFDAGIRLGEHVDHDMVAVPVGPRLRAAIVGSPDYFARRSYPLRPSDLASHRCIGFRGSSGGLHPWEFGKDGRELSVRIGGGPIFDNGDLMVSAALDGLGLAHVMEDMAAPYIADGTLVRVLEDWCKPIPGYYLYYPRRHRASLAFNLFVQAVAG